MEPVDELFEFTRLFSKATGQNLTDDEARWHLNRLVQLYRVLLRSPQSGKDREDHRNGTDHLRISAKKSTERARS